MISPAWFKVPSTLQTFLLCPRRILPTPSRLSALLSMKFSVALLSTRASLATVPSLFVKKIGILRAFLLVIYMTSRCKTRSQAAQCGSSKNSHRQAMPKSPFSQTLSWLLTFFLKVARVSSFSSSITSA
jgi:hypothetical protein